MGERKNFDLEYIEKELEKLSSSLRKELTVYVAGGCAMAYHRLKEATKDLDVVVRTRKESEILIKSLIRIGYHRLKYSILGFAQRRMHAQAIVENTDGFRWDVFIEKVANKLKLTDSMRKRATKTYERGKIKLLVLSKEDIFLMKGMTDRELDLEDMYVMASSGLDYDVILKECELQSDINESVWESGLYTKCEELGKKYGVFVPVMRKLRRIAERKLAARAVYRMIREGASDKVAVMKRKGKLTKRDVELGLEVLVKTKRIRIDKKGKIVLTES